MLKICAGLLCLMGAGVILYIVGSGSAGRAGATGPAWVYAHY